MIMVMVKSNVANTTPNIYSKLRENTDDSVIIFDIHS